MAKHIHLVLIACVLIGMLGCANSPTFRAVAQRLPEPGTTMAVFDLDASSRGSQHESEAVGWLLENGMIVIERSSVHRILDEQRFALIHNESSLLRAGSLLGATEVLF